MMHRLGRAVLANTPASGVFDPRLARHSTNGNGYRHPDLDSAVEGVFVNSGSKTRPDKAWACSTSRAIGLAHESQLAVFASSHANTGRRETKTA